LNHQIRASFRDTTYFPHVVFTTSDLLAASCTCKAGAEGESQHCCVHILPLILEPSILLLDGLAEHFLVELSACWNASWDQQLSTQEKEGMMNSLHLLVTASGSAWKQGYGVASLEGSASVSSFLNAFSVGTERSKTNRAVPPVASELRPFRQYQFVNPSAAMKQRISPKPTPSTDGVSSNPKLPMLEHSNVEMHCAVEALAKVMGREVTELDYFAGYQLLKTRSVLDSSHSVNVRQALEVTAQNKMSEKVFAPNQKRQRQYNTLKRKRMALESEPILPEQETADYCSEKPSSNLTIRNQRGCCMQNHHCAGDGQITGWKRVPPIQPPVNSLDSDQ